MHERASRITAFDRPRHFRDVMIKGRFARFEHDHHFEPAAGGTLMRDVIEFRSPLRPLGYLVDALLLRRYLTALIESRNGVIKREAESGTGIDCSPSPSRS